MKTVIPFELTGKAYLTKMIRRVTPLLLASAYLSEKDLNEIIYTFLGYIRTKRGAEYCETLTRCIFTTRELHENSIELFLNFIEHCDACAVSEMFLSGFDGPEDDAQRITFGIA